MKRFYVLDEREVWWDAAIKAAESHGYTGQRIWRGAEVDGEGVGFLRPHADWRVLPTNRIDYTRMAQHLTMVQDRAQVDVYENKSEQWRRWSEWMPDTWRFTDFAEAMDFVARADYPLVSKADVGASSVNVRILHDKGQAQAHVRHLFGDGLRVQHGASCPSTMQRGYALLQRCIPHTITYRVNAIGNARAVFYRYCYPDRMVAQTGNVEPAFEMTEELESLLEYADRFFKHADTQWCALDVLKDGEQWRLLETSLAWPWPSPGRCNEGTMFRTTGRTWIEMFEVLFDEIERGAWSAS